MKYRWLEDGEMMKATDEFTPGARPTDPNDATHWWRVIPNENVGQIFYSHKYRGTRRLVPETGK